MSTTNIRENMPDKITSKEIADIIRENNRILAESPELKSAIASNYKFASVREAVRFCRYHNFDLDETELGAALSTGLSPNKPKKASEFLPAYGIGKTLEKVFLALAKGEMSGQKDIQGIFNNYAGYWNDIDLSWLVPAKDLICPVFSGGDREMAILENQMFWLSLLSGQAERFEMLKARYPDLDPEKDLDRDGFDDCQNALKS